MLRIIEIKLSYDLELKIHQSMGSIMHGALMGLLPGDIAEGLHHDGLRPFSQYLYNNEYNKEMVWRVGLLDDYYGGIIYDTLQDKCRNTSEIYLKQKNTAIKLQSMHTVAETDFKEITDMVYQEESAPIGAYVRFNSVTSFKHDGQYIIFPDISMMLGSLINKWNVFSPDIKLHEDNLSDNLAAMSTITDYKLRTQIYSLEGIRIKGFSGSISLKLRGNDMARRLIGVLLVFAPYCGIGIKTALGMGGLETVLKYRR